MNGGFLTLVLLLVMSARRQAQSHNCDHEEMMQCLQNMNSAIHENKLFFPETREKLHEYCAHLKVNMDCTNRMSNRCLDDKDQDLFRNFTRGIVQMNSDICTENSNISIRYLKHVPCFKKLASNFSGCTQQHISNLLMAKNMQQIAQTRVTCCSIREYGDCMKSVVQGQCEVEATDLVQETLSATLGFGLQYCRQFDNIPSTDCKRYADSYYNDIASNADNYNSLQNEPSRATLVRSWLAWILLVSLATALHR